MTKEEIVLETALYYNANPNKRRAIDSNLKDCAYITDDGKKCAVGRCLIDPSSIENGPIGDTIICSIGYEPLTEKTFNKRLKSRYRGFGFEFWSELQALHDDEDHWNRGLNRISVQGIQYVKDTFNIDLTKYLTSEFKNKK